MEPNKPIKRKEELVPLSKEHHEGLLFCWKIKQGLGNGTDHQQIASYIQWFWKAHLQEHFRKEEEVLAMHLPKDNELVMQMLEEHQQLEAYIRICEMVADEDIFMQLANGLHDHIRFEERILFPFAEQAIDPQIMKAIAAELATSKPHQPWSHEFWLKKK